MPPRGTHHPPFFQGFVHVGLTAALTAGFGAAAYMAVCLGLGLSLPPAWPAIVQVHGHTQLAGWLGLFIMGVSLHVLPRLSGVPLAVPALARVAWQGMAAALLLRGVAQPLLLLETGGRWPAVAMVLAGAAQILAVGGHVGLLAASLRAGRIDPRTHPKIGPLRPLLLLSLSSWKLFALLMGGGTIAAGLRGAGLVHPALHLMAADLFIAGVLIPVAFVFSLRLFPLYLRIESATWNPAPFALAYAVATALEFGARGWSLLSSDGTAEGPAAAGAAARAALILLFVAALGLPRRRRPLGRWKPERDGAPRFGRYEPLLFAAYSFLCIGALLQGATALGLLFGGQPWLPPAVARHAFVAGFGTLLILGVAPRMVAGFFLARGPAVPQLVGPTLWLVAPSVAVILFCLALPAAAGWTWRGPLFGIAGLLAWTGVGMLAVNLWATAFTPAGKDSPGAGETSLT